MPDYLPIPRFPLPDDLTPVGTMCVRVTIPNDQQYLGTLIGLIDLLKWSRNFARDASGTGAATVSRTWQSALETSPIEIEGCDMPEFRINEDTCLLEVECGDGNWRPVYTPDYDPSTDAPPPPTLYPDPPPPGQSNACLAAANVTAMLQNGANNISILIDDGAIFGAVLANIFSFFSQVVTLVQSQLWPDFQVYYSSWNEATIRADYLAFDWEELKNILVCHFNEDGQVATPPPAEWNDAINEVEDRIPDSQIWSVIAFGMKLMGWVGANLATRWGGIESASCEGCGESCYTYDLESDPDICTFTQPATAYNPAGEGTCGAEGWQTVYTNAAINRFVVRAPDLPVGFQVTSIAIEVWTEATGDDMYFVYMNSADEVLSSPYQDLPSEVWTWRTWFIDPTPMEAVIIYANTIGDPVTTKMRRLVICGHTGV